MRDSSKACKLVLPTSEQQGRTIVKTWHAVVYIMNCGLQLCYDDRVYNLSFIIRTISATTKTLTVC